MRRGHPGSRHHRRAAAQGRQSRHRGQGEAARAQGWGKDREGCRIEDAGAESKSEKKREEESKTADEGKKEAKQQQQQHKEAALGVEGVDHRAIAAGWMPRGNVLVESQRLWSVDRDSESRVLSIASSLAKLDIPGVPKPVLVPALGKSHHEKDESDEKEEKEEKEDDDKGAADAPAPSEEDDAYVDPFGNPVRPMAPPTDPDPDYADDYDKDDKKDKDDKDDDEDHHHHKESDDKDSDDADKQSDDDDDDDEGPTPDPVMPWGFDDDKDHHHHKHDAALGAAPEQPAADGEDVQGRSEASLGARDPMALLAEARREADAARAAKMRAIEGMMRRTSSSSGAATASRRRPRPPRSASRPRIATERTPRMPRTPPHHPPASRRSALASPRMSASRGWAEPKPQWASASSSPPSPRSASSPSSAR